MIATAVAFGVSLAEVEAMDILMLRDVLDAKRRLAADSAVLGSGALFGSVPRPVG